MTESSLVKVLKYLYENGGDSKLINIEQSLPNLKSKEKLAVCTELTRNGLIYMKGGNHGGPLLTFLGEGGQRSSFGRTDNNYNPLYGQITVNGIKYLKESFSQMTNQSININTGNNSPVQVAINSQNLTLKNQVEAFEIIDKIIEYLFDNTEIDKSLKREVIKEFEKAKTEIENHDLKLSTIDKILSYTDQISSIGSFVGMLVGLFINT